MRTFLVASWILLTFVAVSTAQPTPKETESIDFAHGLLEGNFYDMAITQYEEFIKTYPQSTYLEEAYYGIGESYFQSKDFSKSRQAFLDFKTQFPKSERFASAMLRLGQINIEEGKFDEAITDLTAVDFEHTTKQQVLQAFYYYLGKAFQGKKNTDQALTYFQKATEVPDIHVYTAYAFEEIGAIKVQAAQWKDAVDAYMKATSSTEEEPLKSIMSYKIGETLFLSGNYKEAVPALRQVVDQYPDSSVTKDALTNLFLAHLNLNQYDQLLALYQENKSIKEEAPYFNIHLSAARAYRGLKKFDEALVLIDKMLSWPTLTREDQCKAVLLKSEILIKQNKHADGLALLEGPQNCAKDSDEAVFLQAQTYFGLGQFDKALETYNLLKTQYPSSRYVKASLLGMAYSQQQLKKYKEAGDLFSAYVEIEDKADLKSEAAYQSVIMKLGAQDISGAMEAARGFLKTYPDSIYYEPMVLVLAENYANSNQPQAGVDLLKEYLASGKAPLHPSALYFLLGYNLELAGKTDEAIETYLKVPFNKDEPKRYFDALKNAGVIYMGQNNQAKAAEIFERIIKESDSPQLDLQTYLWVCEQDIKDKKFTEALSVAEKVQAHYPDSKSASLYFKAESLHGLNNDAEAVKIYDEILALPQKDTYTGAAHIGKGLYWISQNELENAKAEFVKVLEENADDNTLTLRARFELGNAARAQKNLEEALKFYLLVGTIYQDDVYAPKALIGAAEVLETLNRREESLKVYQDILSKYPLSLEAKTAGEKLGVKK